MTAQVVLWAALLVATIGAALLGGVFFAFSSFIMRALERLPAANGIAAMQAINVTVLNRGFLGVFGGTGLLCLGVATAAATGALPVDVRLALAGAAAYLFGCIGVTVLFNVPRNDRLAGLDPHGEHAMQQWGQYVREWTAWNHARTAACIVAAALLVAAMTHPT